MPVVAAAPASARFWKNVQRSDTCWTWTGLHDKKGYGQLKIGGRNVFAHRLAWELANGPIPVGMLVCHTCDNPACVRADHLFVGTVLDNNRDSLAKGRNWHTRQTHCKRGHEFTEANTRMNGSARVCRACVRAAVKRYTAKRNR